MTPVALGLCVSMQFALISHSLHHAASRSSHATDHSNMIIHCLVRQRIRNSVAAAAMPAKFSVNGAAGAHRPRVHLCYILEADAASQPLDDDVECVLCPFPNMTVARLVTVPGLSCELHNQKIHGNLV